MMIKLSPAEEEYLEVIYRSGGDRERVRLSTLAKLLKVKTPSVFQMIQRLESMGLVQHDRRGVLLTKRGNKRALQIVRRHQLAERLLCDVLDYNFSKIHEVACKLEHILDEELEDKLEHMLGKPLFCPHGEPIPSKDGRAVRLETKPLTEAKEGEGVVVTCIPEEREAAGRLLSLNILPGSSLKVEKRLPGGSILVRMGSNSVALSPSIANHIHVTNRQFRVRRRRRLRRGKRR
jgi:DtxR family Mn-dependent transcriptional regulator